MYQAHLYPDRIFVTNNIFLNILKCGATWYDAHFGANLIFLTDWENEMKILFSQIQMNTNKKTKQNEDIMQTTKWAFHTQSQDGNGVINTKQIIYFFSLMFFYLLHLHIID